MQIKFTRSNEVSIFGQSSPDDQHRKSGRANGIPTCCTNWWINHHSKKSTKAQQEWIAHTVAEAKKKNFPLTNRGGLNYVPCPNCTSRKRFVKVHSCNSKGKNGRCSNCGETRHGLELGHKKGD